MQLIDTDDGYMDGYMHKNTFYLIIYIYIYIYIQGRSLWGGWGEVTPPITKTSKYNPPPQYLYHG